jgi:hypothetical protein
MGLDFEANSRAKQNETPNSKFGGRNPRISWEKETMLWVRVAGRCRR